MDGLMFLIVFGLIGLDAIYQRSKKVAVNSNELMYKYNMLMLERKYKSSQINHRYLVDRL